MRKLKVTNASTAQVTAALVAFIWSLVFGGPAILLLLVAESGRGRVFAFAGILLACGPGLFVASWLARSWSLLRTASFVTMAGLAIALALPMTVPRDGGTGRARNFFSGSRGVGFSPSLRNLVPECDQLMLAFTVAPLIDPLLSGAQASKLRRLTVPLYRQLEASPDFENMGSILPEVAGDAFGGESAVAHAYVYTPKTARADSPNPVVIFFHGTGGNFKAYLWILSSLAEAEGCVVVAPSGGMGNWTDVTSSEALDLALRAAAERVPIDRTRVHLLGLSNGGRALSLLAAGRSSEFASLTFVSPVFEEAALERAVLADSFRGNRIMVCSGNRDDRVPANYIEEDVRRLRRSSARVELRLIDGADHFLMFSHRDEVVQCAREAMRRPQ